MNIISHIPFWKRKKLQKLQGFLKEKFQKYQTSKIKK